MDFLLGVLFAVAFFVLLIAAYMLGKQSKQFNKLAAEFELDEDAAERAEQREKARRLKKGFDEMMAYNETKARKG